MSNQYTNPSNNPQNSVELLKDIAAILGGLTLILIPLIWYLGWRYTSGYFSTMNIPALQLNFTIWEYGVVSWEILAVGLIIAIGMYSIMFARYNLGAGKNGALRIPSTLHILLLILIAVLLGAIIFDSPRIQQGALAFFAFGILIQIFSVIVPIPQNKGIISKTLFSLLVICMTMILVTVLGKAAYYEGESLGVRYIATSQIGVNATLKQPVINNIKHTDIINSNSYAAYYDNLRFLTYNNNNYYVFSTFNSDCKPEQVYLIPQDQVLSLEYTKMPSTPSACITTPFHAP